jgi:hypothetical protein
MTKRPDYKWLLPILLALFGLGVSAFTGYARNDRDLAQRLTKVEAHQADDRQALQEIKAAIKDNDQKLNQVLMLLRRIPRD